MSLFNALNQLFVGGATVPAPLPPSAAQHRYQLRMCRLASCTVTAVAVFQ